MPDAPNIRPIAAQPQGKLPAVHIGLRIQLVVCRAIRIDDAVADRPAEGSHGITVDLGIVAAVGDGIVIVSGSFLKVLQITQEKVRACSRVTMLFGSNVVVVTPLAIPYCTDQRTAL